LEAKAGYENPLRRKEMRLNSVLILSVIQIASFGTLGLASTTGMEQVAPCLISKKIQKARSQELVKLYNADQEDRAFFEAHPEKPQSEEVMIRMGIRDLVRRKRIGEILGEGCLNSSEDYKSAAMIFQHGIHPDHFFQAFVWAKKSFDLGDMSQKSLVALAADRYLVSIGQKQLFGSQAFKAQTMGSCFCIQPIENDFPDSIRTEYRGKTREQALDWLVTLNAGHSCPKQECDTKLKATPKGSLPGFW
jgi:hypothetical protein